MSIDRLSHKDERTSPSALEGTKPLNSGPYPGMKMDRSSITPTTLATWCIAAQAMEFPIRGICRPHVADSWASVVTSSGPGGPARNATKHEHAVITERCIPTPHTIVHTVCGPQIPRVGEGDGHDNGPCFFRGRVWSCRCAGAIQARLEVIYQTRPCPTCRDWPVAVRQTPP